jgi:hypothetical protein
MTDLDDRSWDSRPEANELFANIRTALPDLETPLEECASHWGSEDHVYRFYHQSWKVYRVQDASKRIVEVLRKLAPKRDPDPALNEWFEEIVRAGTGKTFERAHNARWLDMTRPMLEAFFHARFFLEMICKYGREFERPRTMLPNGWAAVLYLYRLR